MQMANLIHATEAVGSMSESDIVTQPEAVWHQVERWIRGHWSSRFRTVTRTMAGDPVEPGWLKPSMFEPLLALDVPVTRLFTLAELMDRQEAS
jgi:hypothetical protein